MITLPTLDGSWDVLDLVTGKTLCSARLSEAQRIQGAALTRSPPTLVYLSDTALHDLDLGVGRESWSFSITNLGLHGRGVLAASPDGQRVALACGSGRSGGDASDLVLLEAGSGRLIFRTKDLRDQEVSHSAQTVACSWQAIMMGTLESGTPHRELKCSASAPPNRDQEHRYLICFWTSTNLKRTAWGSRSRRSQLARLATNLATAAGVLSAELRLWDLAVKQPKWVGLLPCGASAMAFSPDSRRLAVACASLAGATHLLMFDTLSGQELLHLPAMARVESLGVQSGRRSAMGCHGQGHVGILGSAALARADSSPRGRAQALCGGKPGPAG